MVWCGVVWQSCPVTVHSGVFEPIPEEAYVKGPRDLLVRCPNWCLVEFAIDDGSFESVFSGQILSYEHSLDFRSAVMSRTIVVRNKQGQDTQLVTRQVASMPSYHVCAIEYTLTPLNYSGKVTIRSSIAVDDPQSVLQPLNILEMGRKEHAEKVCGRVCFIGPGLPFSLWAMGKARGEARLCLCSAPWSR